MPPRLDLVVVDASRGVVVSASRVVVVLGVLSDAGVASVVPEVVDLPAPGVFAAAGPAAAVSGVVGSAAASGGVVAPLSGGGAGEPADFCGASGRGTGSEPVSCRVGSVSGAAGAEGSVRGLRAPGDGVSGLRGAFAPSPGASPRSDAPSDDSGRFCFGGVRLFSSIVHILSGWQGLKRRSIVRAACQCKCLTPPQIRLAG